MKLNFAMFWGLPIIFLIYDAFEVLEMILLIAYCMFLLATYKNLSGWSFLIVGLITFVLRLLTSFHYAMKDPFGSFGSPDVAEALTEIPFCFAKFLLMWGTLYLARKFMNRWDFFIRRSILKAVICLVILTLLFFLNFLYEYVYLDVKSYIQQAIYDFWLSVIPEFYYFNKEKAFIEHIGIEKGWIDEND